MNARKAAVIVVDVQRDFCPGGSLAVTNGDKIIPKVNYLVDAVNESGGLVLASRDAHPEVTPHFAKDGGVWPVHCVAGTRGAEYHPELTLPASCVHLTKGEGTSDAFSSFDGHTGWDKSTEEVLKEIGIQTVLVAGLATDYCVKATALDAAKRGFKTILVQDASKAVNIQPDDEKNAIAEMRAAGVRVATTYELVAELRRSLDRTL